MLFRSGERDTSPAPGDPDRLGDDVPPEQQPGQVEDNPVGIPPKRAREGSDVVETSDPAANPGHSGG